LLLIWLYKYDFLIKFPEKHVYSAPKIDKITIQSNKLKGYQGSSHPLYTELTNLLRKITGQTGKLIFAQESVASFNVMKGDIIGVKTTLRKLNLISFLEKIIFIVHVGDASHVLPQGKGFFHPHGHIQWGSPLYFLGIRFDNKEKFG
jgi:ribosomal protein L5